MRTKTLYLALCCATVFASGMMCPSGGPDANMNQNATGSNDNSDGSPANRNGGNSNGISENANGAEDEFDEETLTALFGSSCGETNERNNNDCVAGDVDRQFLCDRNMRSLPRNVCLRRTTRFVYEISDEETPIAKILGFCGFSQFLGAANTTIVELIRVDIDGEVVESFMEEDGELTPTTTFEGRYVLIGGCIALLPEERENVNRNDNSEPIQIEIEDILGMDPNDAEMPEACADFELKRGDNFSFGNPFSLPNFPGVETPPDDSTRACIDVFCRTMQECLQEGSRWITRYTSETSFTAVDLMQSVPVSTSCAFSSGSSMENTGDREEVDLAVGDSVKFTVSLEVMLEEINCPF